MSYEWEQSNKEVTVLISLDEGVRAKEINVKMTSLNMAVIVRGARYFAHLGPRLPARDARVRPTHESRGRM